MFEASINAGVDNKFFIKYIDEELMDCVQRIKGLSAVSGKGNRCYYTVACDDVFSGQITDKLTDIIADVILLGYKNEYFKRYLNVKNGSFLANTLVNIMCIFDHSTDKKRIISTIDNISNFSIDGYCNFKIGQIKSKWDEIITLTNTYEEVLTDDSILAEFIAFLVNAVPLRAKQVTVLLDNDSFCLYNDKGEQLTPLDYVCPHSNIQEEIMINLVCHKSQSVVFLGDYSSSDWTDFIRLSRLLFGMTTYENRSIQS